MESGVRAHVRLFPRGMISMQTIKPYLPLFWRFTLTLFGALIIGFFAPLPQSLVDSAMGIIGRKVDMLISSDYLVTSLKIAANNILAGGLIMTLGFLYRPLAYYFIGINGVVIGMVLHTLQGTPAAEHIPWMLAYAWLEIPAVLFCASIGAYHTRGQGTMKREGGALVSTMSFTYGGISKAALAVLRVYPIALVAFLVAGFIEAWVALHV